MSHRRKKKVRMLNQAFVKSCLIKNYCQPLVHNNHYNSTIKWFSDKWTFIKKFNNNMPILIEIKFRELKDTSKITEDQMESHLTHKYLSHKCLPFNLDLISRIIWDLVVVLPLAEQIRCGQVQAARWWEPLPLWLLVLHQVHLLLSWEFKRNRKKLYRMCKTSRKKK